MESSSLLSLQTTKLGRGLSATSSLTVADDDGLVDEVSFVSFPLGLSLLILPRGILEVLDLGLKRVNG